MDVTGGGRRGKEEEGSGVEGNVFIELAIKPSKRVSKHSSPWEGTIQKLLDVT